MGTPIGSRPHTESLRFTGSPTEYFKTWITGEFLTLLTLGLYAAVADEKHTEFILGNTSLEKERFSYTPNVFPRLLGTGLCVVVFVLAFAGSFLHASAVILIGVGLFLSWPLFVSGGLRYRPSRVSYGGVGFNFSRRLRDGYVVYVGGGLLTLATGLLFYPFWLHLRYRYGIEGLSFGDTRFVYRGSPFGILGVILRAAGFVLAVVIVCFLVLLAGFAVVGPGQPNSVFEWVIGRLGPGLVMLIAVALIVVYTVTEMRNYVLNRIEIGEHRLRCNQSFAKHAGIVLSNAVAVIVSFGLLLPWATTRLAGHRLESVSLTISGNLDEFTSENTGLYSGAEQRLMPVVLAAV